MNLISQTAAAIARDLGLDERDIALRKRFLEFGAADVGLLSAIHDQFDPLRDDFADAFYDHLLAFDEMRALLPAEKLESLKKTQMGYFSSLTAGRYGEDYVHDRLRVGVVHQMIGLEPQWYIGAYRKYLAFMMPLTWESCAGDSAKFLDVCGALLKIVLFDMSLALETYFQADRKALLEMKTYAERIVRCMPIGFLGVDPELNVLSANAAALGMLGLDDAQFQPGQPLEVFFPSAELQELARDTFRTGAHLHQVELSFPAVKGLRHFEFNLSAITIEGRQQLLLMVEDISRRKEGEAQLTYLATHDSLTGLPNRNLLQDRLRQAMAAAERGGHEVGVLFIDLDRFKLINDSLGHEFGDRFLQNTAERLSLAVRGGDTVARLGGDEFVVMLPGLSQVEDLVAVAQKILTVLAEQVTISGHELATSGSIGICLYPRDGGDVSTLLKNADTAMYRSKEKGRNNFQFYTSEMNAQALERLELESKLRRALERGEFLLHYQPQVGLASGRTVGVEALLRWQRRDGGMVLPADFIPLAEETGLIVPIGEWVLRTACVQAKAWQDAGLPPVQMAVNLSARQFRQHGLLGLVASALEESQLSPQWLELEITESIIMQDAEESAATLRSLKAIGVQLAIDDFGTGYSSLVYLKLFPLDRLKIDRAFVNDIASDPDDAAIVTAVIALAHSLRLKVTAEGVETAEQLDFLKQHGCEEVQGYYFSRPLAAEALISRLSAEA